MLDVGFAQELYWECSGNPDGKAAVYLHGGPGSGSSAGARRYFDPALYRIVLFDQRGCGRSRPLANEPNADLSTNTTAHLVADIERLREHLNIERWTVLGISWGTTLALAYAQSYPARLDRLVLGAVTTTSRREVEWITYEMGRIFPEAWSRFAGVVPERLRHLPIVDAYASMLFDPSDAIRELAAREWCIWEDVHVSLAPGWRPNPRYEDPGFRLVFARLVTHFWRHAAFLADDQLTRNASLLNHIPGVLIHGRFDISSPLEAAWRLSRHWRSSELRAIESGHGGDTAFSDAIVHAVNVNA